MTIGAIIVARMGSARLPGKNMMKIMGAPMAELMVERVAASKLVDKIVIATSSDQSDNALENLANRLGIGCYRGSLLNVMERIYGACVACGCDNIVELLGDNPLVHSDLIDDVISFYLNGKYDYAATLTKEYPVEQRNLKLFSVGLRVQVYSKVVAGQYSKYPEYIRNESKHPCAYIFDNPDVFRVGYFEAKDKWGFMNSPELTFAVNYQKNFDLIKAIFEKNYANDKNFTLNKVYKQLQEDKLLYSLMGAE